MGDATLRERIAHEMWVGQKEALLLERVSMDDARERADRILALLEERGTVHPDARRQS